MILLRLCRNILLQLLVILVIISSLVVPPAFCQESEDSQVFIAGFNAYQQKDYATSIEKMSEVLQKYPDTPLRDMALFWLSRSYYKAGNQQEAARYLSQFSREYPDNPLRNTVEDELLSLTARYEKGEKLPTGTQPDYAAIQKAKLENERIAAAKKTEEAKAAAESARVSALKQAEERAAADKKERDRVAAVKAEQERVATAKAAEKLKADAAAETARIAAQKTEADRLAAVKAERERIAAANVQETRKAELTRQADLKAEEERKAAARTAKEAEERRLAEQKRAEEKAKTAKLAYREKAISQYKAIIDKYPATPAAAIAATKLRELGVAVALPPQAAVAPLPENAQVLRLEVAQFAGFEFNLLARPEASAVGRPVSIPFEIINRGNGTDSFYLASAFPGSFNARFVSAAAPNAAISQTPDLAPGETFRGAVEIVIPAGSIDGLRIAHPVKAASRLLPEASQSREVRVVASAPLLRAVLRTETAKPLPGNKVTYRVAILNIGSAAAKDVTFRLNFPPQLEPVDYTAAGFRQEMKSALVLDGLQVNSGQSREFTVSFLLKDDSLSGQELSARAELIDNQLKTTAAFVSNMSYVAPQRGVAVRTGSDRLVAIPGQTISVPFVVTNTGNVREKFAIMTRVAGVQNVLIFNDLNRDGIRQANEPVISEVGPLAPHEEASIVAEISTPKDAVDAGKGSIQVTFVSEGDATSSASGSAQLTYSRPVLKMLMTSHDGRLKPGDIASFDLTVTNTGSNLARVVELRSAWPEQLELVASDPGTSSVGNGTIVWRFKETGAGEKRTIKVSFRVKPGISVGTAIQVKNTLTYEDQLGNRY